MANSDDETEPNKLEDEDEEDDNDYAPSGTRLSPGEFPLVVALDAVHLLAVAGSESSHGSEGEEEEAPTLTSELDDAEKPRKPRRAKTKPQEGCAFLCCYPRCDLAVWVGCAPLPLAQATSISERRHCLE
jgi:hypothetical protein